MRLTATAGKIAVCLVLSAVTLLAGLAPLARAGASIVKTASVAAQDLDLVLPLRADLNGLRRFALAVSNPSSLEYGASVDFAAQHSLRCLRSDARAGHALSA